MPSRPCAVTLVDTRGIRHSAEVNAASVFEAAVLALQAFKTSGWVEEVGPGTRLEVQVCAPVTRHTVTVAQLRRWTDGAAVSPSERLKRERLKAMLKDAGVVV